MRPPSVLAVTSELPWPLSTGGHLRTFHLLRALARRCRVRLVTPIDGDQATGIDALQQEGIAVRPVVIGRRAKWREGVRIASAATAGEPYVLYQRHNHGVVLREIRRQAQRERPDVFYMDHLDSFVYRRALPDTPAVMDLHNIYSTLAGRAAAEQRFWPLRSYLCREARLLRERERDAATYCDTLTAVSEEEGRELEALGAGSVTIVPNGVDCAAYASLPAGRPDTATDLLYVGAMSWAPNVAAVCFLAQHVLPRVRDVRPGVRLRIVGRHPAPEIRALARCAGVDVLGEVAEIQSHLLGAGVLAVPLEAGGGTRLKILEAFAAGLPVVSTPVGCEGLGAIHGEHLTIAERAGFANSVIAALADPAGGAQRAARARALARARYDWSSVGDTACDVVARVCGSAMRRAG